MPPLGKTEEVPGEVGRAAHSEYHLNLLVSKLTLGRVRHGASKTTEAWVPPWVPPRIYSIRISRGPRWSLPKVQQKLMAIFFQEQSDYLIPGTKKIKKLKKIKSD